MTTRLVRIVLTTLVLTLALGLGIGVSARPAAASGPALSLRVTGDKIVYSWDSANYTITVTNPKSYTVYDVFFEVYDTKLPIDYHSISMLKDGYEDSAPCRVTDGWGSSSKTRATCEVGTLGGGQSVIIHLYGGTTIVWGSGSDWISARAFVNYPDDLNSDGSAFLQVAWNP